MRGGQCFGQVGEIITTKTVNCASPSTSAADGLAHIWVGADGTNSPAPVGSALGWLAVWDGVAVSDADAERLHKGPRPAIRWFVADARRLAMSGRSRSLA